MDRLTFDGNFCDIAQCRELPCPYDNNCMQKQVWERLKEFEDLGYTPAALAKLVKFDEVMKRTGLTVDRIYDLIVADEAGRVVVLPCKVGDVVYGFHGDRTILPMAAKWFETNTDGWCVVAQYAPMVPKFYRFSDFGKTVFLTREEAEKALEARNGDQ